MPTSPSAVAEGNGSDDNVCLEKGSDQQGILGWLNTYAERNKSLTSTQRQTLWQQAVSDYESTKTEERKACADARHIRELLQTIGQIRTKIADKSDALRILEQSLSDVVAQLEHLDAEDGSIANTDLKQCLDAFKKHQFCKPSFWAKVSSLWKVQRDWNAKQKLLKSEYDLALAESARIARLTKQLDLARVGVEKQITGAHHVLQQLQEQHQILTQKAIDLASLYHADHLLTWLQSDVIGRGDAIELAEPWRIESWRQTRARVFIQALKLHRTFFELEASRMRSNLFLVNGLLAGSRYQGFSRDAIRSAWTSLFMLVPVLSSTFSSFARSFGSLGTGEIGWLFVDEAGQASPQAAVGALWRSRRAVLVGDPLQLKPIVTVSDAVLEHMRTRYHVDAHWIPNRQSAQTLADEATPWGRMAGPVGNKTWVGLPLVVHRRCDKPMYELANRIAYDGAMVYGTLAPSPDKETLASMQTGWIHASGTSQGNWVPAEGEALQKLLAQLHEDGVKDADISVITPFKAVKEKLRQMLRDKIVSGTIHTMQGKEAPVVILVLGGNTAGSGARNWAVSEPNLLNVAATRAKRRLYVIGDRNDWDSRALFCDVMNLLPLQKIQVSEQKMDALPLISAY